MTTQTNQPVDKIQDGSIVGTIWFNQNEKGGFYSGEVSRTYKKGDDYGNSHTMAGTDLLKQSRLAQKLYDRIRELEAADAEQSKLEPAVQAQADEMALQSKGPGQ